ncbi:MAG: HD domain-containing protein [Firmicutes bacterium]|nr:HD domain-containing protein [Bacillota bacterium]
MDFEKCRQAFEKYVSSYDLKDEKILLKYHHSYTVSELMADLAFRLELPKEKIILAKIIGLLHDIGRFEQWKKYHSFSDDNVDHADESCNYLFIDGHIRDFLEETTYDSIIEKAIRNHNKLEVPAMKEEELFFTKMIRDMDKVDIYKQCAIHYDYTFNADEVSEKVLEYFKNEKSIPKAEKKSKSDAILVMLAFVYDINFNESFDILVETDNFDLFLSTVEIDEKSEKLWRKIREVCFDKINRGINKD